MDDVLKEFLAEAGESVDALDHALVQLERGSADPAAISELFRVLHTLKGTAGFLGLPKLEALAHEGEAMLGQFREGGRSPDRESVTPILQTLDKIKQVLSALTREGIEPEGMTPLRGASDQHGAPEATASTIGGHSTIDAAIEQTLLRARGDARLSGALSVLDEAGAHASLCDALTRASDKFAAPKPIAETLRAVGVSIDDEAAKYLIGLIRTAFLELDIAPDAVDAVLARLSVVEQGHPAAPSEPGPAAHTIRVPVDTLDRIMNVASELVLVRNTLVQILRRQPGSDFAESLQLLSHITTELQEAVMTTRMQPIGRAWSKLPRLVRDLSVELGKHIEISLHGEDTELDRQVLELIRDPLTHMIRNAADHGIETPAERDDAGKPATGRISLSARHEGGHVVIEVLDDGRGLCPEKLRAKALGRGLINPGEAEAMSTAQAHALIFLPGFSTAAAVTNVSGRGVGMDVVRANIERLGGVIEMSSFEGQGTRFTIHIPLTLTIISALIVECSGQRFAIPQRDVLELVAAFGPTGRKTEDINGAPVLRLRERLLPLVTLHRLLEFEPAPDGGELCIVVMQSGPNKFGLLVDRVLDIEEIVVKPVARALRTVPLYAGATILGDGAVVMILNAKEAASHIGAPDFDAHEEQGDGGLVAGSDASMPMVIARVGADAWKAAPISLVSRIQDVWAAEIVVAGGRAAVQYQGQLMPLVTYEGGPPTLREDKAMPVLVFEDEGRSLGLVVDEVIDIVDCPLRNVLPPKEEGALGSVIVAGRVADLLDPGFLWLRDLGGQRAPLAIAKRALLVDANPFHRSLIELSLTSAGYEIVTVDGEEAATALLAQGARFDVILLDVAQTSASFANVGPPIVSLSDAGGGEAVSRFDRSALMSALAKAIRRDVA